MQPLTSSDKPTVGPDDWAVSLLRGRRTLIGGDTDKAEAAVIRLHAG